MAEYNESQINSNETERIAAEQQRINNETQRQTKETEREARESTRQSNETTRISKEAERLAEEVNRVEAEANRVTAEQGRVNAENIRAGFYEGFNERLDAVDSQLAHIAVNVTSFYNGNWSDAVQLAHDSLSDNGGTIIIPQGIILEVDKTINITKQNVHIVSLAGRYKSTGFKAITKNMTIFNVVNYGFNLKNIYLLGDGQTGNTDTSTTTGVNITEPKYNIDAMFTGVMFENFKTACIVEGRNILIDKESCVSNCQSGFIFNGNSNDLRGVEIYCRFHSIGKGSIIDSNCIFINPSSNYSEVQISVYADDCKTVISGGFNGSIYDCSVNRAYGSLCDIDMNNSTISSEKRYLNIVNNSLIFQNTSNNSNGITIKGYSKFKVSGNTIINAQLTGISLVGVSLSTISNNTLLNCCYYENYDCINIDANSALNNVHDNYIQITDTSNSKVRHGIHVEGHQNNFNNNKVQGINLDNAFWISTSKLAYGNSKSMNVGNRIHYGNSAPNSGRWSQGDIVYNLQPTDTKNINYWVCVSGGTSGTWRAFGVGQGTTNERPILSNKDIGFMYFDTDMQKMLYYDGNGYKEL